MNWHGLQIVEIFELIGTSQQGQYSMLVPTGRQVGRRNSAGHLNPGINIYFISIYLTTEHFS